MKPTREQILVEPAGRQMDTWVAEFVMKWPEWDFLAGDWSGGRPVFWIEEDGIKIFKDYDDYAHYWSPSSNIAAAWEVVEKLRERNRHITIITKHDSFMVAVSEYVPAFGIYKPLHLTDDYSDLHSNTAPLAICRAALLAVLE